MSEKILQGSGDSENSEPSALGRRSRVGKLARAAVLAGGILAPGSVGLEGDQGGDREATVARPVPTQEYNTPSGTRGVSSVKESGQEPTAEEHVSFPGYETVPPSSLEGQSVTELNNTLYELGVRGTEVPAELQEVLRELGFETIESLFDEAALLQRGVYCDESTGGSGRGCEMELRDGLVVEWNFVIVGPREKQMVADRLVRVTKEDPSSGEMREVKLSVGMNSYNRDMKCGMEVRVGGQVRTLIQRSVQKDGDVLLRFVDARQKTIDTPGGRIVEGERVSELRIDAQGENPWMNAPVLANARYSAEATASGGYRNRQISVDLQYESDGGVYEYPGLTMREGEDYRAKGGRSWEEPYSMYELEVPAEHSGEEPAIVVEIYYNHESSRFVYFDSQGATTNVLTDAEGNAVDVPNAHMVTDALRGVMYNLRRQTHSIF